MCGTVTGLVFTWISEVCACILGCDSCIYHLQAGDAGVIKRVACISAFPACITVQNQCKHSVQSCIWPSSTFAALLHRHCAANARMLFYCLLVVRKHTPGGWTATLHHTNRTADIMRFCVAVITYGRNKWNEDWYAALEQAREQGGETLGALLCCGKPCARELSACGHICGATCHPGRCPGADSCTQEVTVRAPLEMQSWLEDTLMP